MIEINIYNRDCFKDLDKIPCNKYDLCFSDPNYGIGAGKPSQRPTVVKQKNGSKLNVSHNKYIPSDWDQKPVDPSYFDKVFRVSKNQIIWGVNYYNYPLPGGRIVWDKMNGESDQFDCEIAYNSFNKRTDIIYYMWSGMLQGVRASNNYMLSNVQIGNKKLNEKRIHETQKPVILYKYMLNNYSPPGSSIIDTHGGSFSLVIACIDLGYNIDVYEIDSHKYNIGVDRLKLYLSQLNAFSPRVKINYHSN